MSYQKCKECGVELEYENICDCECDCCVDCCVCEECNTEV